MSVVILLTMLSFVPDMTAEEKAPPPLIAMADYPPYHYWVDGNPKGLNIDILNEIFLRIGHTPRYVQRPWSRSLYELEQGDVGALCAGMKTPPREKFAYYPSHPLSMETNWVITLADSDIKINSLDELKGIHIGTITNYSYGSTFDALQNLTKHERPDEKALLELLLHKRVKAIVGCDLVINHVADKLGVRHQLNYQLMLTSDPMYLILSKVITGNEELNTRISDVLAEMIEDGTYQKILDQYLE
ncbi:transporter substrate-binding domain-containing protein [uncultured Pseudodesulfovibrio sp.]|uniref:substrate-binding periplasmic protein n=1 Tax=uncultured Pseudodesulfovibrio sp. TaxID=2035858 RepID=UPI0029C95194|nr:transporter substrate-binding domain-containing protein [uncultured Pseudodesulfovibrio sp.]